MKAIFLAAAMLGLSACSTAQTGAVNVAATRTVISADAMYTSASIAGQNLVDLGKMSKATYQQLDMEAYNVLLLVRAGKASLTDLTAATAKLSNGG